MAFGAYFTDTKGLLEFLVNTIEVFSMAIIDALFLANLNDYNAGLQPAFPLTPPLGRCPRLLYLRALL